MKTNICTRSAFAALALGAVSSSAVVSTGFDFGSGADSIASAGLTTYVENTGEGDMLVTDNPGDGNVGIALYNEQNSIGREAQGFYRSFTGLGPSDTDDFVITTTFTTPERNWNQPIMGIHLFGDTTATNSYMNTGLFAGVDSGKNLEIWNDGVENGSKLGVGTISAQVLDAAITTTIEVAGTYGTYGADNLLLVLTVSADGVTTSSISATVDTTGFSATQTGFGVSANSDDDNRFVVKTFSVAPPSGGPDTTPPAAPTGLAVIAGDGWVSLDWNDNAEVDLGGYSIYRSTSPGSYGAALATGVSSSDYADFTVVNGTTYYYVVTASDVVNNESANSSQVSATPVDGLTISTIFIGQSVSGAADNFISTAENWDNGLPEFAGRQGTINTNANITAVSHDGYDVLHTGGTVVGGTALQLGTGSSWVMDGAAAALSVRGLNLAGATFTLNQGDANVSVNNSGVTLETGSLLTINGGTMTLSRALTVAGGDLTVNGGTLSIPNSIANAVFHPSGSAVNLNSGTTTAVKFNLVKACTVTFGGSTAGSLTLESYGSGATLDWLPGTQMSLSITNETNWVNWAEALWNAGLLKYDGQGANELSNTWAEVTAVDGLEPGVRFNYDSANKSLYLAGETLPLPPPSGLTATPADSQISLDWNDSTGDDFASYSVYRSTTSGSYGSTLASGLTSSEYVDSSAVNGTTYYYVVTAIKTNGIESSKVNEVSAVPGDFNAPAAPTGLSATPGNNSVSLNWNGNSEDDFAGYSVYRSTTSDNYSGALVTELASSSYVDNTAVNGTTYYYVVTATDTSGNESGQSSEVSATPNESGLSGYAIWLSVNGVADTDENFYEYAMDSDPNDGLASTNNPVLIEADGSYFYVYPKRSDDSSITYTVETTTDLVLGTWTNEGYTVTGTDITGGTLNFVTNDVDTVDDEKFIRLRIEQ